MCLIHSNIVRIKTLFLQFPEVPHWNYNYHNIICTNITTQYDIHWILSKIVVIIFIKSWIDLRFFFYMNILNISRIRQHQSSYNQFIRCWHRRIGDRTCIFLTQKEIWTHFTFSKWSFTNLWFLWESKQ